MSFNKKVVKLLKEKKKTKAQLAKAAGIPYTTLDSMLKRETETSRLATIYKIAQYLEVSVEELVFDKSPDDDSADVFTQEEKEFVKSLRTIDQRGRENVLSALYHEIAFAKREKDILEIHPTRRLPVYNAPAAAGEALPFVADDFVMMDADNAPDEATFGVRISGDSMEPLIENECIVWVKKQESVASGDIGIFVLNGESLCKKIETRDGVCQLISLNKKYSPIEVLEYDDLRVIGRVLV